MTWGCIGGEDVRLCILQRTTSNAERSGHGNTRAGLKRIGIGSSGQMNAMSILVMIEGQFGLPGHLVRNLMRVVSSLHSSNHRFG